MGKKKKVKKAKKRPAAGKLDYIVEGLRGMAVPIDSIELDPRNARTHDDANLRSIRASLLKFGQRLPLLVNRRNNQVEAGNGRLIVARDLGWTHIAVVWVEDDPAAQSGFSIADNRTAELAAWNDDLLADLIAEIQTNTPDLADDLLLDDLLPDSEDDADEESKAQDVPESFSVVVECKTEEKQKTLYDQLTRQGHKCRLLVM